MTEERWDQLVGEEAACFIRLTWPEFIDNLPDTLPKRVDLCITGGLARNGFTDHDLDFHMEGGDEVLHTNPAIRELFREIFDKPAHVGNHVASTRPPLVKILLYEQGVLKDRDVLKKLVTVREDKISLENGFIADITDRLTAIERILSDAGLH